MNLVGNVFIHFSTLLNSISKHDKQGDNKIADIEKQIMLNGTNVGTLRMKSKITYPSYVEQKISGILTEKGIQNFAPFKLAKKQNKEDDKHFTN